MSRYSGDYNPDPNKYSRDDMAVVNRGIFQLRLTTSEQRVRNTYMYKDLAERLIYLIMELAKAKGMPVVREFFDYSFGKKNTIVISTNKKYEDLVDLRELHRLFYYIENLGETQHNRIENVQILKYKGENAVWHKTERTKKSLTWSFD